MTGPVLMLIGVVMTYLWCLLGVFSNPYWEDNGVLEKVQFPDHFALAWFLSLFAQLIVIPLVLIVYGIFQRFRPGREKKAEL